MRSHPSLALLRSFSLLPALLAGLPALLAGCRTDNDIKQVDSEDDGNVGGPQITVEPDELYFDTLEVGDAQDLTFVISNVGDEDLVVDSMYLAGSTAFALVSETTAFTLSPAQSIEFIAQYSPLGPEERSQLHIASNDVGNPDALVDLEGSGLFPELLISPNPLDFGLVRLGCSRTEPITLLNTGEATLTIEAMAQLGDNYALDASFSTPTAIAPGESLTVDLTFTPPETLSYESEFVVTSNDVVATQTATQEGRGTEDSAVRDEFWQGDGPWEKTDILFYVDQSGSMRDDQRRIQDNFEDFANRLDDLEMDWQIMVSTKDNGCHNATILTPESASVVETFTDAVDGRGGNYTEAGLTVAANALQESVGGGCNDGFLREDSKPVLVLVSDEAEQSAQGYSYYVNQMQNIAPNVSITAVAGDYPAGCATAEPGTGYFEASQATHGAFLSICDANWSRYFETIANLSSTGQIDTFYLSSTAEPTSIVVSVDTTDDGDDNPVIVDTEAWSYDEGMNAVVFATAYIPVPTAHIVVDYALAGDCEG